MTRLKIYSTSHVTVLCCRRVVESHTLFSATCPLVSREGWEAGGGWSSEEQITCRGRIWGQPRELVNTVLEPATTLLATPAAPLLGTKLKNMSLQGKRRTCFSLRHQFVWSDTSKLAFIEQKKVLLQRQLSAGIGLIMSSITRVSDLCSLCASLSHMFSRITKCVKDLGGPGHLSFVKIQPQRPGWI